MYERNASYLVKHSDLKAKNLNKICLKIVPKSTKMATTVCKFSKNLLGSVTSGRTVYLTPVLLINLFHKSTIHLYPRRAF